MLVTLWGMLPKGVLLISLLLLAACGGEAEKLALPVELLQLREPRPRVIEAEGIRLPQRRERVSCAIAGRLLTLPPAVGSRVQAGDLVARLDPAPYESALAQERAHFQQVEADIKRLQGLRDERLAPTEDPTQLEARLRQAREALQLAERNLRATRILAPFAGRVRAVLLGEDRLLEAGQDLIELEDDMICDVRLALTGEAAQLRLLSEDELPLRLQATALVNEQELPVDPAGRESLDGQPFLRLRLRSPQPLPELSSFPLRISLSGSERLLVPASAVRTPAGSEPFAWVPVTSADGMQRAERRSLRIGGVEGRMLVVLDGLRFGDTILLDPPADLEPGRRLVTTEDVRHE